MSTGRRRVVRNAASSYAGRGLLILSVLLLTPYLFRALGAGGFGTWSVVFAVASVFSLLEVGFSAAITERVAALGGAGRATEQGAVVRAGIVLMLPLGLVALTVTGAVALLGDGLAAQGDERAFRDGLLILGAAMFARFPCVAFGAALLGRQRYDLFNAAEAVAVAGFAVGAVVALESGAGIVGLAVAQAAALVVGGLLFVVLLLRELPGALTRGGQADRRRLAAFGSWTLLADSMTFIAERMDTVMIAALRGAAAAGPYAAAQKLRSGLQSLTLPLFGLLLPMVAELRAAGRGGEVAGRLVLATRVAIQVSVPVAVALALFAPDVVGVWLGAGAPESTATVLAVLMVAEVLALSATPAHQVLVGIGHVRLVGGFGVVDAAANVALSIVLISAYGAIGAAYGTLLTSSLLGLAKVPLATRATDCAWGAMIRGALVPALAASAPAVAVMVAARLSLDEGAARLALGAGAGVGIALAIGLRQVGPARLRELADALAPIRPKAPLAAE